ncbi:hypothetical protein ACWEJZ_32120 [Streptomyces bacillaris]|uniref:hypothetical protein n=1 Tax=unclassified Streptomyces TaxID=2593676 RepID=UPI00131E27D6|nr:MULTISPECIES: hypothetical protein [unclassified Streptomyces]NGO87994.1 hypothetical protein [Streptomyces sp. 196(2019)]
MPTNMAGFVRTQAATKRSVTTRVHRSQVGNGSVAPTRCARKEKVVDELTACCFLMADSSLLRSLVAFAERLDSALYRHQDLLSDRRLHRPGSACECQVANDEGAERDPVSG